jgi:hypothetical protein
MGKRKHQKGAAVASPSVTPIRPDVTPRKKNRKKDGRTIERHLTLQKVNTPPHVIRRLDRLNLRCIAS